MSRWLGRIALASVVLSVCASVVVMAAAPVASGSGRIYLPLVNQRPLATETPPGDLFLQGRVYDRWAGPLAGIAGAQVSIVSCMGGRRYSATTQPDGSYVLTVPYAYVNPCTELTLEASATGYTPQSAVLSVADLRANPQRNIALLRSSTATPTATVTPGGDLTIYGTVYRAGVISGGEIAGALVSATACSPAQRVEALSQSDGSYSLTLPAAYLATCGTIQLQAIRVGYEVYTIDLSVAELRTNALRDIALVLPQTMPALP